MSMINGERQAKEPLRHPPYLPQQRNTVGSPFAGRRWSVQEQAELIRHLPVNDESPCIERLNGNHQQLDLAAKLRPKLSSGPLDAGFSHPGLLLFLRTLHRHSRITLPKACGSGLEIAVQGRP